MKKTKSNAKHYLKYAAIFGVMGWLTAFAAATLLALGYHTYALYMGAVSIFVGWGISGYFWLRFGISEGKSLKEIILHRQKKKKS